MQCSALAASRRRGFTLVEILIVVSLLAVAGLVVAPAFAPTEPYEVDLAASEFADAIRFARDEALRMGVPYGVDIDAAERRIRVFRDTSGTLPIVPVFDVYHPVTKRLYDLDLDTHRQTAGLTVLPGATWSGTCNVPTRLGFDADGTPRCSDPWSVTLDQFVVGLLHDAGHGHAVSVAGISGRVWIQ